MSRLPPQTLARGLLVLTMAAGCGPSASVAPTTVVAFGGFSIDAVVRRLVVKQVRAS